MQAGVAESFASVGLLVRAADLIGDSECHFVMGVGILGCSFGERSFTEAVARRSFPAGSGAC
jgi:hypothetical protein